MRLASLALCIGLLATSAVADPGTLVVLNKSEATASVIDEATGSELFRLETGAGPHEVAVSPDGRWAVVADYGPGQTPGHTLSVLDLQGRERTAVIELGNHTRPHGIVFTPDGSRVVVTTEGSMRVLAVDLESQEIVASLPTRAQISHMVVLTPTGRAAFVTNIGSGTVTVLDLEHREYVADVRTGAGTEGIDISPDGKEVWVTNRDDDTISIIDTRVLSVTQTLPCGSFPIRCKFTPDGSRVLVSCARSGEVAVFDAQARQQIDRIKIELKAEAQDGRVFGNAFGDSPVPIGILIPPDGDTAYVANAGADAIAVIDLATLKVTGIVKAGREPDGMAWSRLVLTTDDAPGRPGSTVEAGS
ncbi:MAG: beta-propeller fold lactonase family protein [Phycisphaeraceae bacterium]|nr:beta-propeller fold lactonase family protein [Phycisphaeraceae bacterium]